MDSSSSSISIGTVTAGAGLAKQVMSTSSARTKLPALRLSCTICSMRSSKLRVSSPRPALNMSLSGGDLNFSSPKSVVQFGSESNAVERAGECAEMALATFDVCDAG